MPSCLIPHEWACLRRRSCLITVRIIHLLVIQIQLAQLRNQIDDREYPEETLQVLVDKLRGLLMADSQTGMNPLYPALIYQLMVFIPNRTFE